MRASRKDTYKSQNDRPERSKEHPHRPKSHIFLGLQIAYFAVFLPFVLWLVWLGYEIANRGFDLVDTRQYRGGTARLIAGGLLALGSAGLLPALGYWLVFEGGIDTLLGD
jgi:hypothetical protein